MGYKATLSFHGGVGSVTGSNFLLAGERTKMLVDCGLIQGEKFAHALNYTPFPYDPASVDYLLITHAHIDHIGRIPKLVRDGFHGEIFSTPETLELSRLMLPDAFSVLRSETSEGEGLLYGEKDIEKAFSLWETQPYHESFQTGEFEVVFKNSGHILGSAMVEVSQSPLKKGALPTFPKKWGRGMSTPSASAYLGTSLIREDTTPALADSGAPFSKGELKPRKIVLTGDLGNYPTPLLKQAEDITDATYLVMESVYGDRAHEGGERRKERLAEVIQTNTERGGTLLIPCFSLEKTQVLLSEMDELFEDKKLFGNIPVFLDSPLAIRVTEVYRRHAHALNPEARKRMEQGDDIFSFKNLRLTMDARASSEITHAQSPNIIIAGSGMSAGGRILGHERRYLGDARNTILFIGYQAIGGLGRQIQEGVKRVRINHEDVKIRARIETITGYSSHMDSDHLQGFVERAASGGTLEKVFVVMGEPRSALFLAQRIRDYSGVEAAVPQLGDSVEIEL